MWNIWIHSVEASILSIICIQSHLVFSRHFHPYAIVGETLCWMEVEDKQQLSSFKSHDFISLMFPAYISLNTNEPCTDSSNTHLTVQISVYKVVMMIYHSAWSFINDWTVNVKWILQQYEHTYASTKLFFQQMHLLLKHKMLQFIFKISFPIWLLHV